MKSHPHLAALPLLCGIAIGVGIGTLLSNGSTPQEIGSQSTLLAQQLAELDSLVNTLAETERRRAQRFDTTLTELELILSAGNLQRANLPWVSNDRTTGSLEIGNKLNPGLTTNLPQAIQDALSIRGLSPGDSPAIAEAVGKATEAYRAAGKESADAIRSMRVEFSEREPTRNRIVAIRDEQWKSAVETLCYVLDDYLKD